MVCDISLTEIGLGLDKNPKPDDTPLADETYRKFP
jgi:hypothetical protein